MNAQNANSSEEWIKAESPDGSIEMRRHEELIEVRDAQDPDKVLKFTIAEWEAWLDGVRKGEFDHMAKGTP